MGSSVFVSNRVHHSKLKSERCVVVKENKEGPADAKPECGVMRQQESFVKLQGAVRNVIERY